MKSFAWLRARPKALISTGVVTVADGSVKVNGKDYKVDLREASAADAAAAPAAASSGTETPVEAPVAGTVLRYVRSNGDHVEKDAVLVCDLNRAQDVKGVVEALKAVAPGRLDFDVEDAVPASPAGTLQ